jgi:hypothetical protein
MRLRQAEKIVVKYVRQTGEYRTPTLFKACCMVFRRSPQWLADAALEIMIHAPNVLLSIHRNSLDATHPVKVEWVRRTGNSVQGNMSGMS